MPFKLTCQLLRFVGGLWPQLHTVCDRSSTVETRSVLWFGISVIGFILSLGKNSLKIWLLPSLCSISHSSVFIFHSVNDMVPNHSIVYWHIIVDEQIHVLSVHQFLCRAINRFEIIDFAINSRSSLNLKQECNTSVKNKLLL